MALATSANLIDRYDERVIRDLLSDSGTPVSGSLTASTRLDAILESASGLVLAACSNANNYTQTELAALTGSAQALLHDIVCLLAMVRLMQRRGNRISHEILKQWNEAGEAYLDMLRKGQRVFPVERHQAAGLPTIGGPSIATINRMNLITSRTPNFYPNPASRLPLDGRGG